MPEYKAARQARSAELLLNLPKLIDLFGLLLPIQGRSS
jgi:hypothetical protein